MQLLPMAPSPDGLISARFAVITKTAGWEVPTTTSNVNVPQGHDPPPGGGGGTSPPSDASLPPPPQASLITQPFCQLDPTSPAPPSQ